MKNINTLKRARTILALVIKLAGGTQPEPKDYQRMKDIITKSKGNDDKIIALCRQMANAIKDSDKAIRRAEAAKETLPESVALECYDIFMSAA